MKKIHTLKVPASIINAFMQQLCVEYEKEISLYFTSTVLNEYFINTYVPLGTAISGIVYSYGCG